MLASSSGNLSRFYFFRRYTLSVWIALAAIVILLVYKIAVIGW